MCKKKKKKKKLWKLKVTVIPIVVGAFGMFCEGFEKGLEELKIGERIEIIPTTELLRSTRILRRILETRGDLLSLSLH